MTSTTLDVSKLRFDQQYQCSNGTIIDLRDHLAKYRSVVGELAAAGLIDDKPSFGFAMTQPVFGLEALARQNEQWDLPYDFTWFAGGWGPDCKRYVANAVRKLRFLLRWSSAESTLALRFRDSKRALNPVNSVEADGSFAWGDFPWGGAVRVQMGYLYLTGAISCLHQVDDDIVARLPLGGLGKQIVIGNGLLKD